MAILRAAYPRYYAGVSKADAMTVLELWCEMFREEPYEIVAAAVKRLIAADNAGWPPGIGQVKEQIRKLTTKTELTEQEAWRMIAKAVNTADVERSFHSLPPMLRRLVGSPSQLSEWGRMDESAFLSVVASNFSRSYKAAVIDQQEQEKLPAAVRKMQEYLQGNVTKSLSERIESPNER